MATSSASSTSSFSFNLSLSLINLTASKTKLFGPRLGSILFLRRTNPSSTEPQTQITLPTPTFITTTSRGIVPHLSRDNIRRTPAVRWVNVPFETFMEHDPPIPTLYDPSSKDPLHTFLGFDPDKQIVSLSSRDPDDIREMPPNGTAVVSVWTLRGVRKLSASDWRTYTLKCQPDIVFSLSDTPFTDPVNQSYSQKRLTKSIERTAAWLSVMLRSPSAPEIENETTKRKRKNKKNKTNLDLKPLSNIEPLSPNPNPGPNYPQSPLMNVELPVPPLPSIFLPLAGGSSLGARRAFASSLLEPFYGPEADAMKQRGIKTLDEGVSGYSIDLTSLKVQNPAPIDYQNGTSSKETTEEGGEIEAVTTTTFLIQTSLTPLSPSKLRLINSTDGPHEILRYITQVGVDVFDAGWAQRLASWGVGLDFEFPVRENQKEKRGGEGRAIGHNLYDQAYAFDLGSIADTFRGGYSEGGEDDRPICACAACSSILPLEEEQIRHGVDSKEYTGTGQSGIGGGGGAVREYRRNHTRAYVHHLLQTHEMGAHTLLAMHNLTVLDRFFEGVRGVLGSLGSAELVLEVGEAEIEVGRMRKWTEEVDRFCRVYDEGKSREVVECGRRDWGDVDRARGKGRLAREKEKEMKKGEIIPLPN